MKIDQWWSAIAYREGITHYAWLERKQIRLRESCCQEIESVLPRQEMERPFVP